MMSSGEDLKELKAEVALLQGATPRRRWRGLRKGLRGVGTGPGAVVPIAANVPKPSRRWERRYLGAKVSRKRVMQLAPPVKGITFFEGEMGAGKSVMMNRAAMVWQRRGSVVWSVGVQLRCAERHFRGERQLDDDFEDIYVTALDLLGTALQGRMRHESGWGHPDRPVWAPGACGCLDGGCEGKRCPYQWVEFVADDPAAPVPWPERYRLMRWLIVCIDEGAVVAGNREWQKFPSTVSEIVTQIRKCSVIPMVTCVHIDDVDKMLRSFAGVVWECQFVWPSMLRPFGGGWIRAKAWPPNAERKEDETPLDTRRIRIREADSRGFNSWNYVVRERSSKAAASRAQSGRGAKQAKAARRGANAARSPKAVR